MALYLSEWFLGEEEVTNLMNYCWDPHLVINEGKDNAGILGFTFLSSEGEQILMDIIPNKLKNEFYTRYHSSMDLIYKKIGLPELFGNLLVKYASGREIDMDTFNKMNYEFCTSILDYDCTELIPLSRRLVSLIFFGSWDLIQHYKILVDPESIK